MLRKVSTIAVTSKVPRILDTNERLVRKGFGLRGKRGIVIWTAGECIKQWPVKVDGYGACLPLREGK
uniref:Uncharacterized protein n=1 Tax=Hyaloperonospora arabidopsidis (strain Emoy2) TaxID=559515 RepID=M4BB35_HYAAE